MSTTSDHAWTDVAHAGACVRERIGAVPDIAVVLGSGLGAFADALTSSVECGYGVIPGFPTPTVAGHEGRVVAGACGRRRVLVLAGRVHLYEGQAPSNVTFPMRVLGYLGVKTVVLTNAAGGINTRFTRGSLMCIDDHINFTGSNPLVGAHDARLGPRFPDMSDVYSPRLRSIAVAAADRAGVRLEHGVYIGVSGPSYETPAEIRAFRTLGADAVGMSTVHEAITARQMGLDVLGICCISNMAAGVLPQQLSESEVLETTRAVQHQMAALLEGIIAGI
ncbi:MAG: purine-nucleoside phosphorylase [Vicinamibacterales bacterium]